MEGELITRITRVYRTPYDEEAGIPPLFEYQCKITKIQPDVKIVGTTVNYEVPEVDDVQP